MRERRLPLFLLLVSALAFLASLFLPWRQTHVAGPTDLHTAPLPAHNYVGEYQGLAGLTRGFAAAFTLPAPQAKDGPTDIFFARIGPGDGDDKSERR